LKVVETNQLRCTILDFEIQQGKRVAAILKHNEDALERVAEARQAKTANTVKKGMPIVEEHNFMKWEVDTEVGETNQLKDEFDEGENLPAIIVFIKLTRLLGVIEKTEQELDQLSDKFTYEAMLHNTLAENMKTFMCVAKLPTHEAALWVPKNSDQKKIIAFRPIQKAELKQCKVDAFAWMKAAAIHHIELEEQQTNLGGKQVNVYIGGSNHDEDVASGIQGGQDVVGRDEAAAFSQAQVDWPPNFCNFCNQWGHVEEYCREIFPEEEQADWCYTCDREGHTEETCWVLHPHLRLQWLTEQKAKAKKMTCHHCGKTGHIRRWCHILHN
jgi:hypothetical protein